jgi:hypothetical protein
MIIRIEELSDYRGVYIKASIKNRRRLFYQTVREYPYLYAVGSGMNRTPLNRSTLNIRSLQARPMRPALFGERMLCSKK